MLCTHAAAYLVCARPRPLENCAIFLFAVTERVELFGGGGRQPRNNRTVRKETAAGGGARDHTAGTQEDLTGDERTRASWLCDRTETGI